MSVDKIDTTPSVLAGAVIITGAAVGAGMFSMPTASSGMWFGWSVACMAVTCFCMFHIALMILEVNLNYPLGASFYTFVNDTLGPRWNFVNNLLILFVLYVLNYAYISGGGSVVKHMLDATIGESPPQLIAGTLFALGLSFLVWLSTRAVSRTIVVLMVGMALTFI